LVSVEVPDTFTGEFFGFVSSDPFKSVLETNGTQGGAETYTLDNLVFSAGATPLPGALPLFASGLGALGLLGWRRKRKAAA
jgi:PEP-CTERM motif